MSKNSTNIVFRDNYYYNLVRNNIISYRNIFSLTQAQLANILNIEMNSLAQIESSKMTLKPSIHLLGEISELFDINITNMFLEKPPIPKNTKTLNEIKHHDNYYCNIARKNIKKYRKFNRIKQQELSLIIGKHYNYISKLETSKSAFTLEVLGRIADTLEIPITKFFDE